MSDLGAFVARIAALPLTAVDRAVALLWYFRQAQEFDERTAAELADDLRANGLPRPNITRLHRDLARSSYAVRGKRAGTFQLHAGRVAALDGRYGPLVSLRPRPTSESVLPLAAVSERRPHLRRLVEEINGTYDAQFYNSCAVMARRLLESLLIEMYIHRGLEAQIKDALGRFIPLEQLIGRVQAGNPFNLGRNSPKAMSDVKELGDIAAHDRAYQVKELDLNDIKQRYRRLIEELATNAGAA